MGPLTAARRLLTLGLEATPSTDTAFPVHGCARPETVRIIPPVSPRCGTVYRRDGAASSRRPPSHHEHSHCKAAIVMTATIVIPMLIAIPIDPSVRPGPARQVTNNKLNAIRPVFYTGANMVAEQVGPQQPLVGPPLPLRAYPEVNPPEGGLLPLRLGDPLARSLGRRLANPRSTDRARGAPLDSYPLDGHDLASSAGRRLADPRPTGRACSAPFSNNTLDGHDSALSAGRCLANPRPAGRARSARRRLPRALPEVIPPLGGCFLGGG